MSLLINSFKKSFILLRCDMQHTLSEGDDRVEGKKGQAM